MKQRFSTKTIVAALIAILVTAHVRASDQIPGKPQDHPIALVGATIHTVSGSTIDNGTVLFEDGKITAVGTDVEIPEGAEEIDVKGKHVYPGLIGANSRLGLVEIGAVRATRDYAEVGDIKPNVRAEVAINPDSELLPVTRANGITLVHTIPMGGLISGTSAMIMLDGWTWESMTFKAPVGLYLNWPFMGVREAPWIEKSKEEQLKERDEQIQKIKGAFAEVRAYMKAKEAEAQKEVPYHDTDLRWEAMIPVLEQKMPVLLHTHGIRQIQAALDWAAEENIKAILLSGQDARFVVDQLKENDTPVIFEGTFNLPRRRWEPYDTPYSAPLKLYEAGVKYCIAGTGNTFEAPHERNLPYHAAMAAAHGLPKDEALKAVTLYPAQILGVADRIGSIEVGKDATLIVTDGDPLEIVTHVEREFIQGRKIDLSSRHMQLYEKYKTKYQRLQTDVVTITNP
ncbi:amidohydrolase family protein [candidate division KSB1 bacterium]|nr:amidohydrolase family protein [candidate division KSB1 bacterium]NIR72522.1 amidohydrolase family protein [candidate division KSB1 bacterium]NIS23821.1 amidohydrolase family protein [candidate division KSB1 bacterium]NIT70748.1 amidohydrolase family protein [candidate division KSB1 bacterium]NIU24263.1 amidohydrolase family protein [candidate division KSB1 bacterium]